MVGTGAIKCLTVLCVATGLGASGLGPAAVIPQQNPRCWDRDGVGELLFPPAWSREGFCILPCPAELLSNWEAGFRVRGKGQRGSYRI